MTYCLAVKTDAGIVFASDSRTNAGVDNVNSYSKMHAFILPGERCFVLLTAGNLATTQAVINTLQRDFADHHAKRSLRTPGYLFDAAEYVGEISCKLQARHAEATKKRDVDFSASFILGGQIADGPHEILMVYPEGNVIAVSPANPYLQIGETKYGKPILDRVITHETSLEDAARCALVSIDSTMRSNISVGPPIELRFYRAGSHAIERHMTLDLESPFYDKLRRAWGDGLNRVFRELPPFEWE
jgi:putative proteasome-type protease